MPGLGSSGAALRHPLFSSSSSFAFLRLIAPLHPENKSLSFFFSFFFSKKLNYEWRARPHPPVQEGELYELVRLSPNRLIQPIKRIRPIQAPELQVLLVVPQTERGSHHCAMISASCSFSRLIFKARLERCTIGPLWSYYRRQPWCFTASSVS